MDIPIALKNSFGSVFDFFFFYCGIQPCTFISHTRGLLVDTGKIPLAATIVLSISFFKALKSSIINSELPHQYFAEEVAWIVTGK